MACDADLGFAQVTPAAGGEGGGGGKLPSPTKQLDFDAALGFYTPPGAAGTLRSPGLQLIESPVTNTSSERSQSVACALHFMDKDDLVTSADETVSMGSTHLFLFVLTGSKEGVHEAQYMSSRGTCNYLGLGRVTPSPRELSCHGINDRSVIVGKRHGRSSGMRLGWRSSLSGVRTPVRLSVQGPVGEVPATAPFSSPLHHWYRRWMGGVSRPRSFSLSAVYSIPMFFVSVSVLCGDQKGNAPGTAHL